MFQESQKGDKDLQINLGPFHVGSTMHICKHPLSFLPCFAKTYDVYTLCLYPRPPVATSLPGLNLNYTRNSVPRSHQSGLVSSGPVLLVAAISESEGKERFRSCTVLLAGLAEVNILATCTSFYINQFPGPSSNIYFTWKTRVCYREIVNLCCKGSSSKTQKDGLA